MDEFAYCWKRGHWKKGNQELTKNSKAGETHTAEQFALWPDGVSLLGSRNGAPRGGGRMEEDLIAQGSSLTVVHRCVCCWSMCASGRCNAALRQGACFVPVVASGQS
jgi:hypothetical protein